jgi:hypothetical protein
VHASGHAGHGSAPVTAQAVSAPAGTVSVSGNVALGQRLAGGYGWGVRAAVGLPERTVGAGERLGHARHLPEHHHAAIGAVQLDHDRLWHPASLARSEDGRRRAGLAHRCSYADPLGARLYRRHLRLTVRRMGA